MYAVQRMCMLYEECVCCTKNVYDVRKMRNVYAVRKMKNVYAVRRMKNDTVRRVFMKCVCYDEGWCYMERRDSKSRDGYATNSGDNNSGKVRLRYLAQSQEWIAAY